MLRPFPGEERQRRFWVALSDQFTRDGVEPLPYMSGSGFINRRVKTHQYVFCMNMGRHPTPWFRWSFHQPRLAADDRPGDRRPIVDSFTLTAVIAADPGDEATGRHLPDAAFDGAFGAWGASREHSYAEWNRLTDPNSSRPDVPKVLRDAWLPSCQPWVRHRDGPDQCRVGAGRSSP